MSQMDWESFALGAITAVNVLAVIFGVFGSPASKRAAAARREDTE